MRELEERIYYRDMATAAGETVDAAASAVDKERLARLTEFRHQHPEPPADADAPTDPEPHAAPAAPAKLSRPSPVRMVEAAISEKLTPDELLHWQELQKGTKQTVIAEKLGDQAGGGQQAGREAPGSGRRDFHRDRGSPLSGAAGGSGH